MKNFLIIIIFIFQINISYTQSIDSNKLDTYFSILEVNNKFMGSVAVFKDNEIVFNKQYGYSEVETQTRPDKNTKYRIGSVSKTLTAVLVFKAVEQSKISLSETIDSFFPGIKNADKITIANLLNHRSGIHSYTDDKNEYLSYHTQRKSEKEMVEIISQYDSNFEPNIQAEYSNSNYLLLSYILEKIYNNTFAEVLNDELCVPLKLENTYFAELLSIDNNEAYSYRFDKKWNKEPQTNGTTGFGAGDIISTPTDLIKFSDALFNGKIISYESLSNMKTLQDNFGMGLFQTTYYNTTSFGHNGGIDGFMSMLRYFPEEKIAFAVTANGIDYNFNSIESTLANTLLNRHFDIPVFSIYKPGVKELNQYVGKYSSDSFPVVLNVVKSKKQLILQVSGEESMPLEAFEKGKFKFDPAGLLIEFIPDKNELLIKQGGKINTFKKE